MKVGKQQLMDDHKVMNWFRLILDPNSYANPEEIITINILTGDDNKLEDVLKPTVAGAIALINGLMHQLEKHTPKKEA